jgi:23S rRNA (uracil1939-C5)-methyltransferase
VGRIVSGDALQGKVAFVPYTLPDEIVAAQPLEEKKTYLRCVPRQLLKSSPDRITPACPYYFTSQATGLWCGGCNWQHLKAETQRAWKTTLVRETLQRLGHLSECPDIDLLHTAKNWRYRNTAQFVFDCRDGAPVAGYFAPGSHSVVSIEDCLIQSPIALRILATVRRILPELGLKPFARRDGRGWLKHLLIRSNEQGEALIALITGDARFPGRERFIRSVTETCPEISGIFHNVQPSRTSIVTGRQWMHLWGEQVLKEQICGLTLAAAPGSFLQVNSGAAQLLYERALREAQLDPGMTVLDLYCGAGALALMAAATAGRVIGIDALGSAIEDARKNARLNGIDRVTFHAITAERFLRQARDQKEFTGDRLVVFVDPPRAGCQPAVVERLLSLAPRRIIYLSCNPATLARDIHLLGAHYHLASLAAVDLFPQTSHIETIARMERKLS